MSSIVLNILEKCSALQRSIREYRESSPTEQQEIWEDLTGETAKRRVFVHGQELLSCSEQAEPKRMVEESLQKLGWELLSLPADQKQAFVKVSNTAPDYVNDRAFRLKFLRAEKFRVPQAAMRMVRHFEEKRVLFGEDQLGRDITLADLNEDDMAVLRSGYLQVLPELDRGHRQVLFYYKALCGCYKEREHLLRAFWYVANALSANEQVQKLGAANLVYNVGGSFPQMDYEKSRRLARLFQVIPLRFNSFYPCIDDTKDSPWRTVVETFSVMIGRFLRIRLRIIQGRDREQVAANLKAVGIPGDALPINDQSELLLEQHWAWLDHQQQLEQQEPAPPLALEQVGAFYLQPDVMSDLLAAAAPLYQPPPPPPLEIPVQHIQDKAVVETEAKNAAKRRIQAARDNSDGGAEAPAKHPRGAEPTENFATNVASSVAATDHETILHRDDECGSQKYNNDEGGGNSVRNSVRKGADKPSAVVG